MKNAIGNASSASVTVTAAAIRTVRSTIVRYTSFSSSVWKLSRLKPWTISPENVSRCQNAAANSTASEPR